MILQTTDQIVERPRREVEEQEEDGDEDEDEEGEVKILEEEGEFEEVLVWGHEVVVDEADCYVRGVEEWIGFAESVSFGFS